MYPRGKPLRFIKFPSPMPASTPHETNKRLFNHHRRRWVRRRSQNHCVYQYFKEQFVFRRCKVTTRFSIDWYKKPHVPIFVRLQAAFVQLSVQVYDFATLFSTLINWLTTFFLLWISCGSSVSVNSQSGYVPNTLPNQVLSVVRLGTRSTPKLCR